MRTAIPIKPTQNSHTKTDAFRNVRDQIRIQIVDFIHIVSIIPESRGTSVVITMYQTPRAREMPGGYDDGPGEHVVPRAAPFGVQFVEEACQAGMSDGVQDVGGRLHRPGRVRVQDGVAAVVTVHLYHVRQHGFRHVPVERVAKRSLDEPIVGDGGVPAKADPQALKD